MNRCPICKDFEPDDHEEFEQHLQWVHIAPRDFGPEEHAMPNLMQMMMGGWITPQQFAVFAEEILNVAVKRTWNVFDTRQPVRELVLGLMMGFSWGGLVAIWDQALLTAVFVGICIALSLRLGKMGFSDLRKRRTGRSQEQALPRSRRFLRRSSPRIEEP